MHAAFIPSCDYAFMMMRMRMVMRIMPYEPYMKGATQPLFTKAAYNKKREGVGWDGGI